MSIAPAITFRSRASRGAGHDRPARPGHLVKPPAFLQPVIVLGAATAAFSAGVGFLPVVGRGAGLGPVATGAAVSVLAASSALGHPLVGKRLDAQRLRPQFAATGLAMASAGLLVAALLHGT